MPSAIWRRACKSPRRSVKLLSSSSRLNYPHTTTGARGSLTPRRRRSARLKGKAILVTKKAKAADDVPGIYRKRNPARAKVGSPEALSALNELISQRPWTEWFAAMGAQLAEVADSDDPDTRRDAREALTVWRWLIAAMGDDPKIGSLVEAAMRLGTLEERIQIRPFDEYVRTRNGQLRAIDAVNTVKKLNAESGTLRAKALAAIEQAKLDFPKRDTDIDYIKTKAAASLGITKRALNSRLSR